ncbi:Cystatin domain [Carpediemonas membranifera]|uniref:Cystatin domain n=1 Tax=Carpediemonas membranifera TaxID=201153 RepID=A0A8J6BFZ9_9EUKA|nr:Cystatin domain [Carpediemonas membranifera]|eukprot:KAG9396702.1 Cystatin domain [Carpediemonas membranifera]
MRKALILLALAVFAAAMITGGFVRADQSDPEVQEALSFAVDQIKEQNRPEQFVRLIEAYTQVVNGINFRLIAHFATEDGTLPHEIIVYKPFAGDIMMTKFERFHASEN